MRGITVTLYSEKENGTNSFGEPEYKETAITVDNVLVAPSSSEEVLSANDLYGKKAVYTLAIPKGDTNDWQDKKVSFFGKDWKTFGIPTKGIDHLVPTAWNTKVMVMRCE